MPMLFENQQSDGVSSTVVWKGGTGTLMAWGEFGDGTLTLQAIPYRGTAVIPVSSATTLTVPGTANFTLPAGTQLRAQLSGAAGSPSVNMNASVD